MKSRFDYLLKVKGLGLFTGNAGFGITYTLRRLVETYNQNLYKFIYIHASTVTVNEFYRETCYALGIDPPFKKIDMFKQIQENLTKLSKERKITPVIVIDEAQYLKPGIFHDLSLLMNFEMDSKNYVTIVLIGLSYKTSVLSKSIYEPLRQRIIINYEFIGLSKSESESYISKFLTAAENQTNFFSPPAIESIYNYSGDSIRKMNNLLSKCLIQGANKKADIITPEIVLQSQNDMEIN